MWAFAGVARSLGFASGERYELKEIIVDNRGLYGAR